MCVSVCVRVSVCESIFLLAIKKIEMDIRFGLCSKKSNRANKEMQSECPICYKECAKLSVTCCNGHTVCEKHHLQRCKVILGEGRKISKCRRCFLCQDMIAKSSFSTTYWKVLDCVIAEGVLKRKGYTITADNMRLGLDTVYRAKSELGLDTVYKPRVS